LKANSEQKSQHLNRELFTQYCEEARLKYADFELKIKKVEQKVTGSICGTFNLDEIALFAKFVDQGFDDTQMFDYIRAEYLNLIIDRKKFVKAEKERLKNTQASSKQSQKPLSVHQKQEFDSSKLISEDDFKQQKSFTKSSEQPQQNQQII